MEKSQPLNVVVEVAPAPASAAADTNTTTSVDDDEPEEVEVEVEEIVIGGVMYLKAKNNKLYDPETSDFIGVWNESTSGIDVSDEDIPEDE